MLDWNQKTSDNPSLKDWGLYLHVPYCLRACPYCDFHFSTRLGTMEAMVQAQQKELTLRVARVWGPLRSLYIGGGTPSLLDAAAWDALVEGLALYGHLASLREFTLEANPDDVCKETLSLWRQLGVSRLSIGVQSFHHGVLKVLGRTHDGKKAYQSVAEARTAGFRSLSLDLMYGIPGVARRIFQSDVKKAVSLAPNHISAYILTIEPQTVFGRRAARGQWTSADENEVAWQFHWLSDYLEAAGYTHYELSNFACGQQDEALHNRSYWSGHPYLGIGPGAHSYDGSSVRWQNAPNNARYIQALQKGALPPGQAEVLSPAMRWREYLITGLRSQKGIDLSYAKQLGLRLPAAHEVKLRPLVEKGFLIQKGKRLSATKKGWLVLDKLMEVVYI